MTDIQEKFNKAVALHQAGKLSEAKDLYKELLKYVKNVDLFSLLAITSFDLKQYEESILYAEEGLKIEQRKDLTEIIANSYLLLNDLERSIEFYVKLTLLDPTDAAVFFTLAKNLYKANRIYRAAEAYLKAVSLNPTYARIYEPIGNILR